jgi:hypothetical protein
MGSFPCCNGNNYSITFVDAFNKFTSLFPIQCKSDVLSVFHKFHVMVERLSNTKIKQIKTDGVRNFND